MILLVIADHASDEGDNAWPSQKTIATRASCNIRTVQRAINELTAKGYLWIEKRGGGSANCRDDRRPHRYTIVLNKLRGDKTPTRKESRGDIDASNEATLATGTGRHSRPLIHTKETPIDTPDDFDKFWKEYPRKTAKGAAKKAWSKLIAKDQQEAIAGAKRFAEDPNREELFTPYPATWLNAEQWNDEPLPQRKRSPEENRAYELEIAMEKTRKEREASQMAIQAEESAKAQAIPMPEYIKKLRKKI